MGSCVYMCVCTQGVGKSARAIDNIYFGFKEEGMLMVVQRLVQKREVGEGACSNPTLSGQET